MAQQQVTIGPRTALIVAEFMAATRGVALPKVKAQLQQWCGSEAIVRGAQTKGDLALRYAKGRLSKGGAMESQRLRKLSPDVLRGLLQ